MRNNFRDNSLYTSELASQTLGKDLGPYFNTASSPTRTSTSSDLKESPTHPTPLSTVPNLNFTPEPMLVKPETENTAKKFSKEKRLAA